MSSSSLSSQSSPSGRPTASLVDEVRSGDVRAWIEVDARYRRRLALLIRGRIPSALRRRFDTDDIVQSAIFKAYQELDSFEDDGSGSFHKWISRILLNRFYTRIRFHRARLRDPKLEVRQSDLGVVHEDDKALWVEPSDVEAAETIGLLLDRLSDLPEERSLLIQRRFFDGLTFRQLADEFNTSEATVRRRVATALLELRNSL